MAPPPPFADLGKSAKDLFSKGYAHGFIKLDVKSEAAPSVEFKSAASHNLNTQKMAGNLEVKYKVPEHGLTITEKWNTDNQVATVAELKDKLARGLKLTLDTYYTPHNAKRGGVLKAEWAGEAARVNGEMTLFGGPLFNLAMVGALKYDFLIGGQAKFDLATNEVKSTAVALDRKVGDYTLHSFTVDGREFGASLYHQVHKAFEYGVQIGWKNGDQGAAWGLASKYVVNPDLTIRAKVDNKSQVALAATHGLSDAVKLTLSTHFGFVGLPEATNKFGVGLEYSM